MNIQEVINRFCGVRVVGDIHGHSKEFKTIVDDARDKNLFVLSLGDLVDRGPDSPGVMDEMNHMIRDQTGAFIVGNHDDKLYRWIIGNKVSVGNGMSKTIGQLDAIPEIRRANLIEEFWRNIQNSHLWLNLTLFGESYLFVHGAYNPGMAGGIGPLYTDKKKYGKLSSLALYAESSGRIKANGYPERTYGWTDSVYTGLTVMIGHDYICDDLIMIENSLNGRVFMMDTGSGKGGKLSYLDILANSIDFPDTQKTEIVKGSEELVYLISQNHFTRSGD